MIQNAIAAQSWAFEDISNKNNLLYSPFYPASVICISLLSSDSLYPLSLKLYEKCTALQFYILGLWKEDPVSFSHILPTVPNWEVWNMSPMIEWFFVILLYTHLGRL